MYENSPYNILARHNVNNMDEARQNVLGGETAIWTEQSDAGNILSKVNVTNTTDLNSVVQIEPRTAAYGESLWLGEEAGGWREAHPRLVNHRERLMVRGITADQITQRWCIQNPGLCLLSQPAETNNPERCPSSPTTSPSTPTSTTSSNGGTTAYSAYLTSLVILLILVSGQQ